MSSKRKEAHPRRPRKQFEIVSVKCQQNALEMVCKVILATQCLSVRVTCYLFQGSPKKGIKIVLHFFYISGVIVVAMVVVSLLHCTDKKEKKWLSR